MSKIWTKCLRERSEKTANTQRVNLAHPKILSLAVSDIATISGV